MVPGFVQLRIADIGDRCPRIGQSIDIFLRLGFAEHKPHEQRSAPCNRAHAQECRHASKFLRYEAADRRADRRANGRHQAHRAACEVEPAGSRPVRSPTTTTVSTVRVAPLTPSRS